jgi:hypothetical protein
MLHVEMIKKVQIKKSTECIGHTKQLGPYKLADLHTIILHFLLFLHFFSNLHFERPPAFLKKINEIP